MVRVAQRVFLVNFGKEALERVASAVAGPGALRRETAAALAEGSLLHFRRATISEMVISAAPPNSSEDWGFARNCMPYLIAAEDDDAMVAALDTIARLTGHDELEGYFVEQARALGVELGPFDREQFVEPHADAIARWIEDLLEQASGLRTKALTTRDGDAVADYAVSSWIWLAQIFARTSPCFWHGRNRWLGGAAFPEDFEVQTNVITVSSRPTTLWDRVRTFFGASPPEASRDDPELEQLMAGSRELTRQQLARRAVQQLRTVLTSTATLAPAMAIEGWEASLAPGGGGYLASGAVPHGHLDALIDAMNAARADDVLPYEDADDWAASVVAAARWAKANDAHLVEADDALHGGYRWPAFDP